MGIIHETSHLSRREANPDNVHIHSVIFQFIPPQCSSGGLGVASGYFFVSGSIAFRKFGQLLVGSRAVPTSAWIQSEGLQSLEIEELFP